MDHEIGTEIQGTLSDRSAETVIHGKACTYAVGQRCQGGGGAPISASGLQGVSTNSNLALGRTATSHSETSARETRVESTPKCLRTAFSSWTVVPKMLRGTTIWSADDGSPVTHAKIADMPDAVATHRSAPSRAAMRSSKAFTVGPAKRT